MSKRSKRRPTNKKRYDENHTRIFGKKQTNKAPKLKRGWIR